MEKHARRLLGSQRAFPGKGDEYHRILQTLAGMHRDNPHAVVVTFQTQQSRFFCLHGILAHRRKPVQRGRNIRLTGSTGSDTFGQVQEVGQAALAVSEARQARQHFALAHQFTKHPHESVLPPTLMPTMKACEPGIPLPRIRFKPEQLRDIQAHQIRHQGAAQHGLAPRLGNRLKKALKLHRLKSVEDAFVALAHARNPGSTQRILHGDALNVIAHEHRYILGTKSLIAQHRPRIIQTPDFASDCRAALRPGDPFGDGAIRIWPIQCPDDHRCIAMRVVQRWRAAGRHSVSKRDSVIDKTVLPSAPGKESIDRTHKTLGGTMIGVQGVTRRRVLTRLEVSKDICAPE